MKITKFGHCCLLVETGGKRILIDPGMYSHGQNFVKGVSAVLVTHEHLDHLHLESLRVVIENNPGVRVFTTAGVGKLLDAEQVVHEVLSHRLSAKIGSVDIEGFGKKHAEIYRTVPPVDNTGFLIGGKFFYPGDAFTDPGVPVEILAMPFSAPWLKISEAIDYVKQLKPKTCFPVHDGLLKSLGPVRILTEKLLKEAGIRFQVIEDGASAEL